MRAYKDWSRHSYMKSREKKKAGEKEFPRKYTLKSLAAAFANLSKLLTKSRNMDHYTKRFSLI